MALVCCSSFPVPSTATEQTDLPAWPIGSPHVAGSPQSRSGHLPPSGVIPRRGLVVAQANVPAAERSLIRTRRFRLMGLSDDVRSRLASYPAGTIHAGSALPP